MSHAGPRTHTGQKQLATPASKRIQASARARPPPRRASKQRNSRNFYNFARKYAGVNPRASLNKVVGVTAEQCGDPGASGPSWRENAESQYKEAQAEYRKRLTNLANYVRKAPRKTRSSWRRYLRRRTQHASLAKQSPSSSNYGGEDL